MIRNRAVRAGVATIAAVGIVAAPGSASEQQSKIPLKDHYCNAVDDYCTGVGVKNGRIKLQITSFTLRGEYDLCVRGPNGSKRCKDFRLEHIGGVPGDRVDWAARFPDQGPGKYNVTWDKSGSQLGPSLSFRP